MPNKKRNVFTYGKVEFLSFHPVCKVIFLRVGVVSVVVVVFLVILEKIHPISVPKGEWVTVNQS